MICSSVCSSAERIVAESCLKIINVYITQKRYISIKSKEKGSNIRKKKRKKKLA